MKSEVTLMDVGRSALRTLAAGGFAVASGLFLMAGIKSMENDDNETDELAAIAPGLFTTATLVMAMNSARDTYNKISQYRKGPSEQAPDQRTQQLRRERVYAVANLGATLLLNVGTAMFFRNALVSFLSEDDQAARELTAATLLLVTGSVTFTVNAAKGLLTINDSLNPDTKEVQPIVVVRCERNMALRTMFGSACFDAGATFFFLAALREFEQEDTLENRLGLVGPLLFIFGATVTIVDEGATAIVAQIRVQQLSNRYSLLDGGAPHVVNNGGGRDIEAANKHGFK